jgi:hypothetical protein
MRLDRHIQVIYILVYNALYVFQYLPFGSPLRLVSCRCVGLLEMAG